MLETDTVKIVEEWRKHYAALAADPTGHSKNASYWDSLFPNITEAINGEVLNRDLSWEEVCNTISCHMKVGKAAGLDRLTLRWFRLAIDRPETVGGEKVPFPLEPSSTMGKVLFGLCKLVWRLSTVPESWQSGTLVSIFKKGDSADMGNYRGITLMAIGLKIVVTLVTRRLVSELEAKQVLHKEQAGFRPGRSCGAGGNPL